MAAGSNPPTNGRPTGLFVAVAVMVAIGGLAAPTAMRVDARSCPGAAELLTAVATSVLPALAPSVWLDAGSRVAIVLVALLVCGLVQAFTRNAVAAGATAVAVGLSPFLLPRLDPAHAMAAVVAAATVAALLRHRPTPAGACVASAGCVATALLLPSLAVPMALTAATIGLFAPTPRRLVVAASSFVIPILAGAVVAAYPGPGPDVGCLMPAELVPKRAAIAVGELALSLGPYASALALLGMVDKELTPLRGQSGLLAAAYGTLALLAVVWAPDDAAAAAMPAALFLWVNVGSGLNRLLSHCSPRLLGRVAAVTLVVLLPVLQRLPWRDQPLVPASSGAIRGLTRADVAANLEELPQAVPLHREDAVTDILVDTQTHWHSSVATELTVIDLVAPEHRVVFGFPRATARLRERGFAAGAWTAPALSRLQWYGGCETIGGSWGEIAIPEPATSLAVVATRPEERGPAILYVQFAAPPAVVPRGWAPVELRGFHLMSFEWTPSGPDPSLVREMAADALPEGVLDAAWSFVARLEVFRTPVSAEALVIDLGIHPQRVVARVAERAPVQTYAVCSAFPGD